MKLSAVSSVFVNFLINDAAMFIAQAGCRGIDVWGGRPHVYRSDYSQAELKALRQQLDDSNLKVVSFMPAFFRYPHSISSPNDRVRQDSIDYMRACLDNGVTLGADTLLIVPGRSLYNQGQDDARQRLIDSIDAVCQAAAEYPIKLGIEPANQAVSDLVITADDALHIINTLNHDNLGVVLDTGHIHLNNEDLEDSVQKLGHRLLQFHINDNDGKHQQNRIPGDGTFDFESGMRALAASGFDGYLSIELGWEYTVDPFPAVQESVKRMEAILDTM